MADRASEAVVLVDKREGIATVTLNRPRAMNALCVALRSALTRTFEALAQDDETGVVILTGAGERAFCAGLDLEELARGRNPGGGADSLDAEPGRGDGLIRALEGFPRPIIAAINGVAVTGGFELALACDVLIGSTNARFADTHARVGIMPGWGLSQKLSRLIGVSRAKELSLTGNFLDAECAERWGLLNRVVAPEALLQSCEAIARDMLSCQPGMLAAYKDVIDRGFEQTLTEGRRIEIEVSRAHSKSVTPEQIAEVRGRVIRRGRQQAR